jgi:hypothetical protein
MEIKYRSFKRSSSTNSLDKNSSLIRSSINRWHQALVRKRLTSKSSAIDRDNLHLRQPRGLCHQIWWHNPRGNPLLEHSFNTLITYVNLCSYAFNSS